MAAEVSTRTQRIQLRPDGVVQTLNLIKDKQTLEDAQANVAACWEVGGHVRRPVYVDTTLEAPLSSAAQEFYGSPEAARVFTAVAILTKSVLGRIIGNFMLGRKTSGAPIQLFDSETAALVWLRGYPPEAKLRT